MPPLLFAFSPGGDEAVPWIRAHGAAHAEQLKSEALQRAQKLQAGLPSLQRLPLTRADLDSLGADDAEDDAPMDDMLGRAERHVVLQGAWLGGTLTLRLHDTLLVAALHPADDADDATRSKLPHLLHSLSAHSGWPLQGRADAPAPAPANAAQAAWQQHLRLRQRLRRDARRERRWQAAGPPAALLLTAAAWAAAAMLVHEAIDTGTTAARADRQRTVEFTAQQLAGAVPGWHFAPRYRLTGAVDGGGVAVPLDVPRDVYLRAAPGARYTVVPTSDPRRPVVLDRDAESPLLQGEGWGVSRSAVLALLPLVLWGLAVVRPIARARTPQTWARLSRRAVFVLGGSAAAAAWWRLMG